MNSPIIVETVVEAPIEKVWEYWNSPEHITQWAFASDDWECPSAENDLKVGGKFKSRMQSKENHEEGFDFTGTYTAVEEYTLIEYDMTPERDEKPRHVKVEFVELDDGVKITQTFDPESENPEEMQRAGWQAILDNFKKHVETG